MTRPHEPNSPLADGRPSDTSSELVGDYLPELSREGSTRTVLDALGEGFSVVDEKQEFLFVNTAGGNCFGLARDELRGRNLAEFIASESSRVIREQLSKRRRGGTSTYDLEIIQESGRRRHLLVTASPRFSENAEFRGALAIFRDITERKRIEEDWRQTRAALEDAVRTHAHESHESRVLLRAVIERSSDIIFLKDLDGRYRMLNSAARTILGRPIDEVIGKTDRDLLPLDRADQARSADEEVVALGEVITEETLLVNGVASTFRIKRTLLRDADGNANGILAIARDVTELEYMQWQLHKAEGIVSVGALMAGILREARAPLQTIERFARSIAEKADNGGLRTDAEAILGAAKRAGDTLGIAEPDLSAPPRPTVGDSSPNRARR